MTALPQFPNLSDTKQQMFDKLTALRDYLDALLGSDGTIETAKSTLGLDNALLTDGAQTISGVKTFSVLPESSVPPSADNQLVNKKYVDDNKSQISIRLDDTTLYIRNDGQEA